MNVRSKPAEMSTARRVARTAGVIIQVILLTLVVFLASYRLVRGGSEAATFRYEGF